VLAIYILMTFNSVNFMFSRRKSVIYGEQRADSRNILMTSVASIAPMTAGVVPVRILFSAVQHGKGI